MIELPSVYSWIPCLGRMLMVHVKMVAISRVLVCMWPSVICSFSVLFSRGWRLWGTWFFTVALFLLGGCP